MNEVVKFVADYGFAVGISVYLLVRMENKIETLTKSIDRLNKKTKDEDE